MPTSKPRLQIKGAATKMETTAAELQLGSAARKVVERLADMFRTPDWTGNLFEPGRPGIPLVRPDDLLALRLELRNLEVAPGHPPTLQRADAGAAYLIVHFPPQSIGEEVFPEPPSTGADASQPDRPEPPAGFKRPPEVVPSDDIVGPRPIRARAAGESRIVFEWPEDLRVPYTTAGVLAAVQHLAMKVPASARPREEDPGLVVWWPGAAIFEALQAAAASQPQARITRTIGAASIRQATIALRGGSAANATLARRLADLAPGIGRLPVIKPIRRARLVRGATPKLPTATETALELPWRLILSPHRDERWRHATRAVASDATGRVELWHSRLLGADADENDAIEPPRADPARTVRAVWATTGPGGRAMQSAFPTASDLPTPGQGDPFLATLDDYDRYQVSHLSANFSQSNYKPEPIDTRLLMLSALGGWLDSRGAWDPQGLDLEEWTHRASMGRDHYVRVVYRGVLFPFGHRAALIKVSERKFHHHSDARRRGAYLRQRFFLVVRQRVRDYDDAGKLMPYGTDNASVKNEFPFTQVRILTRVTPDLVAPAATAIAEKGQLLFWPAVGTKATPFRFRMSATDLDGRSVDFDLPLIFMSNSLASPRERKGAVLEANYPAAALAARQALAGWNQRQTPDGVDAPRDDDWTFAHLRGQRVALAASATAGDTSIEAHTLTFGAHAPGTDAASVDAFSAFSGGLARPMFFPRLVRAQARINAIAGLTGNARVNLLHWNDVYARAGFGGANLGEVFADVIETGDMARLDFSGQGDRGGGFVMPNLTPTALSRALGPTGGPVTDVLEGTMVPEGFFPPGALGGLPSPLLFGCIPLAEVINKVEDLLGNLGKVPKFASEAATRVESFCNDLLRLYPLVQALASQPAGLVDAAFEVIKNTLGDLAEQARAYTAAERTLIEGHVAEVRDLIAGLQDKFKSLAHASFDGGNPLAGIDLADALPPPSGNGKLQDALGGFRDAIAAAPNLPANFRQSVCSIVGKALDFASAIGALAGLYAHAMDLCDALRALVDNSAPGQSLGELITKPGELAPRLAAVANALDPLRADVLAFALLEGAARKTILAAIDAVAAVVTGIGDFSQLLENLLGEDLVIRFDWNPEIRSWGIEPGSPPLFVVHDPHAFVVSVEARVKKSGGAPKIQVHCGLRHFDLVLVAPASFIELNFEKIEFTVDSSAKMNVDVVLTDIKFVGPLSFVETLRDLIPLDGFSDPPYLDISSQGLDAGFSIALPNIAVGILNLSNVSLGAGFTVPFIGQPLAVRFNFCTREQPFQLTVALFGGGGFFGVTVDPSGVQLLEAAFEFGAAVSVDFGVASGGVSVMAGIYFRMEQEAASLSGYFRLEGHVNVLGLITASIELYLELHYETTTGKAAGLARLTIEISLFIFSGSVTIECSRQFAGSNGDPTLRQVLGPECAPGSSLAEELATIDVDTRYAWRDYLEAFA